MRYSVQITSESAPHERQHWTLTGLDDKDCESLDQANEYKILLEAREIPDDEKEDRHYEKLGPLVRIYKIVETDDQTVFVEVE